MKEYSHQCVICNKPFVSEFKETLACSPECSLKALISGAEKPFVESEYELCSACGIDFKTYHSGHKFCCRSCREKHYKEEVEKRLNRGCLICGEKFRAVSNPQKYCSHKCRLTAKRNNRK